MDSSEDEDDQDLLNIKVAGSAYSTFGVNEVLTEHACNSILLPPSPEGCQSTHNASSPEVKGNTEVLTVLAYKSVLQLPGEDDQDLLNTKVAGSSYSTFGMSGITQVFAENACKSVLQPSGAGGHECAHDVRSSPEVRVTVYACKPILEPSGSDRRESTRVVRNSPYFPSSGKKPTFSLQSLNKYLMRSV